MEWSNPYNSFNSAKGLCYYPEYKSINEGRTPPAVEVSIDPINICNLNCSFCNSKAILRGSKVLKVMSLEFMKMLVKECSWWGSRGFCFAGGGEPLMNPAVVEVLPYINSLEKDSAIITNGTMITGEGAEAISSFCRWIGFSIDAATPDLYRKIKGITYQYSDSFDSTLNNLFDVAKIARQKTDRKIPLDVCFKFLFTPENCHEIFMAATLARDLGATSFHVRPAASEGFPLLSKWTYTEEQIEDTNSQLEKIRDLETKNFKVYSIRHKFKADFQRKNDFKKCIAYPLILQVSNDGWAYACVDSRSKPEMRLFPLHDHESLMMGLWTYWGSDEHKEKMASINPQSCPRCILTEYHKQCDAVGGDNMCISFP